MKTIKNLTTMDLFKRDYSEIDYRKLTNKENLEYLTQITMNNDQSLREEFINLNLPLVMSIAKNYYHGKDLLFSMSDLIQEGVLGLIYAIDNYDIKKNNAFSTYAATCIRGYILKLVECKNSMIHMPQNIVQRINKLNKAISELSQFGTPSVDDLVKYTGYSKVQVINALQYDRKVYNYGDMDGTGLDEEYATILPNVQFPTSTFSYRVEDEVLNPIVKDEFQDLMPTLFKGLSKFEKNIVLEAYVYKKKVSALARKYKMERHEFTKILNNACYKIKLNSKIVKKSELISMIA